MKGKKEFSYEWNDATWRFASAENRDLFAADPERYAPQYGGYWTAALSDGEVAPASPKAFKIIDGKLYLAFSKQSIFFQNPEVIAEWAGKEWAKKTAGKEWAKRNKKKWLLWQSKSQLRPYILTSAFRLAAFL